MYEDLVMICFSREELSGPVFYNSALVPLSLSEIVNVIYFGPPWDSLLTLIRNPFKYIRQFARNRTKIVQRGFPEKLKAVKLFCILPWGWQASWTRKLNEKFLLSQITWNIHAYPSSKRILLTYWRDSAKLFERVSVARRVYHCTDEIAGFPWPTADAKEHAIMQEAKVAKMSDVVLVTAPSLLTKMSLYNKNVKILGNDVVDFDLFSRALHAPCPEELRDLQRPIVGYVGVLAGFKVDFDLVSHIASSLSEWTFVFIGPLKKNCWMPKLPNLHYLGSRTREEIPTYVANFDICILPHIINLYMSHSFPMKFFEYLALGKPVVATDIPALQPYRKYFYRADSAEQFEESLREALDEDSLEKQQERIQLASLHSWKHRGAKIMQLISEQ